MTTSSPKWNVSDAAGPIAEQLRRTFDRLYGLDKRDRGAIVAYARDALDKLSPLQPQPRLLVRIATAVLRGRLRRRRPGVTIFVDASDDIARLVAYPNAADRSIDALQVAIVQLVQARFALYQLDARRAAEFDSFLAHWLFGRGRA